MEVCDKVLNAEIHGGGKKPLRASLFEPSVVKQLQEEYRVSEPYRHLVISELMDDEVLRAACEELKHNMQATLKETDIFKVGQWMLLLGIAAVHYLFPAPKDFVKRWCVLS